MGHEGANVGARGLSRRRFLGGLGGGAVGAVTLGHASGRLGAEPADAATPRETFLSGRFGRMFSLPAFAPPTSRLTEALKDIGRPGGILDGRDQLSAGPLALLVNPTLSANNPNSPSQTAGTTFFGQFVDHDVTFDTSSTMGRPTAPQATVNARTPALDLDSVYGAGPVGSPQLYQAGDRAKFRVESGGLFEDLPRLGDGSAVVADPRNDENLVISGLHCAFLLAHNRAVDLVRAQGANDVNDAFSRARTLVTWHYQWLVVREFLPQVIGPALVNDLLVNGRRSYKPAMGAGYIPVEFQGAAYRMGHSMVRPSYRANLAGDRGGPFFAMIFDAAHSDENDPPDLSGGHRAPRRFIDWQTFFDFDDDEVRPNKLLDTKISSPLFALPMRAIASRDQPVVLPQRTLLRHITWMMPSGQAIARTLDVPVLPPGDLQELAGYRLNLEASTPLWYYVLKEAEVQADGRHLGAVGGRIVGEVLIGLLQTDPASYLAQNPAWVPTLPRRNGTVAGPFGMADFLTFAGVDPASRGQ